MNVILRMTRLQARPLLLVALFLAAAGVGWSRWSGGLWHEAVAAQGAVTVVNAASFNANRVVTPDTIAAAFGSFNTQGNQAHIAPAGQTLPTTLGGVRVRIGNLDAGLFFVAPTQINFLIPAGVPDGNATVTVTNANGSNLTGTFTVVRAAPGIFTAKASGQGAPAALTTTNGVNFLAVFDAQGNEVPVSAGTRSEPNILVLYGTGIRNAAAGSVSVRFQGVPGEVQYAGQAPGFEGLDQINVRIPAELSGLGSIDVVVRIGDRDANTVKLRIGGEQPPVRVTPIAFAQTVNGTLSVDDQIQQGTGGRTYFFDAYEFTTTAPNTSVAVDVRSNDFDAVALLYRVDSGQLVLIAADDQSGAYGAPRGATNNNALLMTILMTPGRYVAFVTSADTQANATGNYSIGVISNFAQQLSYGQTVNGSFTTSDLKTSADTYLDVYWFNGAQNDNVRVNMNSATLDSFLLLHRNDGDPYLTFDDNTGGGNNAQITYRLPATGIYLIIATPLEPNRTGDYALSLNRLSGFGAEEREEALQLRAPGRELRDERGLPSIERYGSRRIIER